MMRKRKNNGFRPGLLVAVAAAALLGACGGDEDRQAEFLAQAQAFIDEGNYEKARIDVKNALQINSNSAQGLYLMALLDERDKNWQAMYGNLKGALQLDPSHFEATVKYGQLNLLVNNQDEAQRLSEAALSMQPASPDALALAASVALRSDDRDVAEKYALQTLDADPGHASAVAIMVALYAKDDPDKALAFIDAGRQAKPDDIPIRLLKLQVLDSQGREDDVIAEYQALIADFPDNAGFSTALANYYAQKGRLDEAQAMLRQAVQAKSGDTNAGMQLVQFLMQHRSVGEALTELEGMLQAEPSNFKVRNALGELYVATRQMDKATALYEGTFDYDKENGPAALAANNKLAELALVNNDPEGARDLLDEVLEIEPKNPEALITRARMHVQDGDYEAATSDLRQVLRASPDSVPAMLLLAESQQRSNSTSLALENYEKVLQLQPNNPIALFQGARLLSQDKQYPQAAKHGEKLLQLQPGNVEAINLLADIYSQQQRWDEAVALTRQLAGNEETSAIGSLMEGNLALRQGKFQEAAKLGKSALDENQALADAVPLVAQAHASMGDVPGAIEYVNAYLVDHPDSSKTYEVLARLYTIDKQLDKATDAYRKSLALNPAQTTAYVNLARVYLAQDKVGETEAMYAKGVEQNPDNILLKTELAGIFLRSGRYDDALALLEAAYALDNNSVVAGNNLAGLLLDHYPSEDNLRRVQKLTQGYGDAEIPGQLDTLGWLHYKLGNLPQAISLLESAQAKGGQGLDYWYHLGMAYYKNDQPELAKEQLGKFLAGAPPGYFGREEAERINNSL
jgi:tetratricopeptide (TPR) repeat protein